MSQYLKPVFLAALFLNVATMLYHGIIYYDTLYTTVHNILGNNTDNLRNLSTIISAVVSVINLLLIIGFTTTDRSKKSRQENVEKIAFWFREVILKKNIDKIHEFFDGFKIKITLRFEGDADEYYQLITTEIFNKKMEVMSQINDQINIIDPIFAQELDNILDKYEDVFTIGLEEVLTSSSHSYDSFFRDIDTIRKEYFNLIYNFEKNGYKYVQKKEKKKNQKAQTSNTGVSLDV